MEGSAYEGEEKEHLSPLGLSEGQWAFHVSIRHHFLRRPFLQTDMIFEKNIKNYSTLIKRFDQTTFPTLNHGISEKTMSISFIWYSGI